MSRALSTRVFGTVPPVEVLVDRLEALDTRGVFFHTAPAHPRGYADALRAAGVAVAGLSATANELDRATGAAAQLRAGALVVDAGDAVPVTAREAQIEGLLRRMHAVLRAGAPAAVRPGDAGGALLDEQALAWVLDDLPGLGLWLDPVRVMRCERADEAPGLVPLLDRFAGRCVGTFVAGLGTDGRGGRHPEDAGPEWSTLAELLPRGVPWVLDLDPDAEADELEDAMRYLRHLTAG